MRILYLTNIPAPYRVEFFNQLAEQVDLTVVYEEHRDGRRDDDWLKSAGIHHDAVFLDDQRAGAAVELIGDIAPERLAKPDDAVGMGHAIASVLSGVEGERAAVDARLCECVRGYTIEAMVEDYVQAFRIALGGGK